LSLDDVLNKTLIEMSIEMLIHVVMSIEDRLTVSIDAQPGMPFVHHSFFVQNLLTFAKAINTLRKLQKILKQDF